ncbi:hypothetical protein SBV1_1520006 [Verrucomicrobia bacterium]|nr:hypothetical protein SBV1_1520006 [Verrucomicrobiota bacterium]
MAGFFAWVPTVETVGYSRTSLRDSIRRSGGVDQWAKGECKNKVGFSRAEQLDYAGWRALSVKIGIRQRQPRTPNAFASRSVRGAQRKTLREVGPAQHTRKRRHLLELRLETGTYLISAQTLKPHGA